jgi:hypothetical protein
MELVNSTVLKDKETVKFLNDTRNALESIKKKYSKQFNEEQMNNIIKNISLTDKKNKLASNKNKLVIRTICYKNKKYYKDELNYLWSMDNFKRIGVYYNNRIYLYSDDFKNDKILVELYKK